MSHSVRVLVTQHGCVLYDLSATQLPEYREQRNTRDDWQTHHGDMPVTTSEQEPKVKPPKYLYLDTRSPFSILLFKHKDCTRLQSGFWHTESLNGRVRMGNAGDRSPSALHGAATAFPFSSNSAGQSDTSADSHSESQNVGISTSVIVDDGFEPCGSLRQQVDAVEGVYKLRLSPAMRPSREDHILAFRYKDITMKRCPYPQSPDPSELNFTFFPGGVSSTLDSDSSDTEEHSPGRALSLDGSSSWRPIIPVALRMGQINLNGASETAALYKHQLQGLVDGRAGALRKRKFEQGEQSPLVPDSISNIHQYMSFDPTAKRTNRGQYPRSQPSWLGMPHCAPLSGHGTDTLLEGHAYEMLAQKLVKTSPWNERSLSF